LGTGVVTVSSGGLSNSTLASGSVLYGSSTSAITGNSTLLSFNASQGLTCVPQSTVTNAITTVLYTGYNNVSGTAAAGMGAGLKFILKSTTTTSQDATQIAGIWSDATHASRTAYLSFQTVYNATALAEAARLAINSIGSLLTVGVAGTSTGQIVVSGSTSGATGFKAPATAGSVIYTLPGTDGNTDEFLQTNAAGTLQWAPAKTAPVGGATDISAITAAGGTRFANPFGTTVTPVAAYSKLYTYTHCRATTIKNLYVKLDAAPGTGNTVVVTIYKNNTTTGITVTISNAATTGSDTTNTVNTAAGDDITMKIDATGTSVGTTLVSYGFQN
jgi:hypothetical protein